MNVNISKEEYDPVFIYTSEFTLKDENLKRVMPLVPQTGTIYKGFKDKDIGGFMLIIPEEERKTVPLPNLPFFNLMGFFASESDEKWDYEFVEITHENLLTLPLSVKQIRYLYKERTYLKNGKLKNVSPVKPSPDAGNIPSPGFSERIEDDMERLRSKLKNFKESEGYVEKYYPDIAMEHAESIRALDYFLFNSDNQEIPIIRNLLFDGIQDSSYSIGKIKEAINDYHNADSDGQVRKALYNILTYVYVELARL